VAHQGHAQAACSEVIEQHVIPPMLFDDLGDFDRQRAIGVLRLDLGNVLQQAADKAPIWRE